LPSSSRQPVLSFSDRTGEIAFAVLTVIIINGYVALSDLSTGFIYIVTVNIGACIGWGMIDGLLYATSSSAARNSLKNTLTKLKSSIKNDNIDKQIEKSLDSTFISTFSKEGKEAITRDIITYLPDASLEESSSRYIFSRDDMLGWLSIIGIYVSVGILLALPFLIFPDKLFAWLVSNVVGVAWLFWYGVQLGKLSGKNPLIIGLIMVLVSVIIYVASYFTGVL
jgi:VIT1/CCC1 family predicted Fe2+/Mn2+ transporter